MKRFIIVCAGIAAALLSSCSFVVDGPTSAHSNKQPSSTDQSTPSPQPENQKTSKKIGGFFPFEDNSNKWHYTEPGGNTVTIAVTDTISDDGVTYFRVSFRENRVDTTDDWFSRSSAGIYFGQSLTGAYDLFLPTAIDTRSGVFESGDSKVTYTLYDSLEVNKSMFHDVVRLHYSQPIIHGFDDIVLADLIGIVSLVDDNGRWPINYAIDSCSVGGVARKF
jgi:hypothetical protein